MAGNEGYGVRWMRYLGIGSDGLLLQERKAYETLRDQLKFHPTLEQQHHPLSESDDNPWNQFYADEQLVREINTDLDRLYPQGQETFFQERKDYMDMLRNVLFVWCKQYPTLAYRQGMHDLVAVVLYAYVNPNDAPNDSAEFLEHDTYILFQRIMVWMQPLYAIQTIAPAATPDDAPTTPVDDDETSLFGPPAPRVVSPEDRPLFRASNGPDADLHASPSVQSPLQLLCHVVQYELLAKHDPQLACHLQNVEVLPETYCLRWLRLLLAREFPLGQTLRVWDALFEAASAPSSSPTSLDLLPYLCVAMLVHFSPALRSSDNTGCLQLLMRPPSTPLPAQTIIDSALLMHNPMKENSHEDMDVVRFVEGSLGVVLTNAKSPYDFRLAVKEVSGQALESGKVHVGDLVESINGVKMYQISTDEIKKHIALLPRPLYVSFLHVEDSIPTDANEAVHAAASSGTAPFLLPDDATLPPFLDGEQCYAHVETSMHQPVFHAPSGSCASHFVSGRLFLTNYRCLFQGFMSGLLWEIPILSIASIVSDAAPLDINPLALASTTSSAAGRRHSHSHHAGDPQHTVVLHCKDTQKVKFAFRDGQEFTRMHKCLSVLAFPASLTDAFCFHYRPHILPSDVVARFDIRADYQRVGLLNPTGNATRFRCIDQAYLLCDTYPRYVMVPTDMSDTKLQLAAAFRSSQRLPVVCWQHPTNHAVIARSSQPLVGLKSARCAEDEQLVQLLCGSHASTGAVFPSSFRYVIMDARGQLAAAGNKAMGKGTENTANYRGAKLVHMNMENIHAIRNSFQSLSAAFDPLDTDQNSSFFQKVDSSGWLKHVRLALKASWELADYVHSGVSVLTHCSDGWDRTAQMVSLAELMLDPYYRTLEGFQVLVEKEWCSFGHQFGLRSGHARSDVSNEQRSPIFFLWLDCVHQVMRQFGTEFEFSPTLLLFLADHVHSCKYGNFMFDCEKARVDCFDKYTATNVWCDVNSKRDAFENPSFSPQRTVLAPSTVWKNIALWTAYFARFDPTFVPPVECIQYYS